MKGEFHMVGVVGFDVKQRSNNENRFEKDVDWASHDWDGIKGKSEFRNNTTSVAIGEAIQDFYDSRKWD